MNNQTKAYIAGIGMVTPLGFNSAMTSAAVRAGISSYASSDQYHNHAGEPITLSLVPDGLFATPFEIDEGDDYSAQYDRIIKLSILALGDIFNRHPIDRPVPLILTMAEPQAGVVPPPTTLLTQNLLNQNIRPNLRLARNSVHPTYTGRAGGIEGLDLAFRYLHDAGEDYVLVGGSDSHLDGGRLHRLDEQRRLLAPGSADGFAPGEGGAFILLTRHPERALCRHGQIVALSPPGIANEPGHLFSDEPYRGEGLDQAFKKALKGYTGGAIRTVYTSMNGEHHWAKEYGVAMIRNAPHFHEKVKTEHPADCYGDLGAATGSALIGLAAEQLFEQKGAACLVYGASDNGWRAATLMETVAYQGNIPPAPFRHPALDSDWPETERETEHETEWDHQIASILSPNTTPTTGEKK